MAQPQALLKQAFEQALAIASPKAAMKGRLPEPPKGRTLVIAIGKAAASMARAVELLWPEDAPLSGLALTRYQHGETCHRITVIEAAHPVPDDRGERATARILQQVKALTGDDLLLFLVSGGGSALMVQPREGLTLDDKKRLTKAALRSGLGIGQMNVIRKHLSAVKGGKLAQLAYPAKVHTCAISDVPGDDPSTIASGPTVADPSTPDQALALLKQLEWPLPPGIIDLIKQPQTIAPRFDHCTFDMVLTPGSMFQRLISRLEETGLDLEFWGADIEGYAHQVAALHAKSLGTGHKNSPKLYLSGGETSVKIEADAQPGRGGRNTEYLLALAIALQGRKGVYALAADTDGIDGTEDAAGAMIGPETLARAQSLGLSAQDYLDRHDSYSFFKTLGDLLITGPTRTNVNDFRAIWVSA